MDGKSPEVWGQPSDGRAGFPISPQESDDDLTTWGWEPVCEPFSPGL